ncbi:MAG: transcriptional regulator [Burkholderiaceae bacterium]|nr:transcriptional regulator [Burkholderiaceae bacterium]MCD8517528.1 transcriptional regulator [Burkholderiaceae bacterium]MCD8537911.1 transcriptional regulator [Burkholderiaceae bacterium]MCD8565893.1 transcriptional regulator [Burkholderiaceae bacterium]
MEKHKRTLLVVIAEANLERMLVQDIKRLGAAGYTVTDVRGGGHSGVREGTWEADRTIRMEVVCEALVADKIAASLLEQYGKHYGLTIYFSEVSVLRPNKF